MAQTQPSQRHATPPPTEIFCEAGGFCRDIPYPTHISEKSRPTHSRHLSTPTPEKTPGRVGVKWREKFYYNFDFADTVWDFAALLDTVRRQEYTIVMDDDRFEELLAEAERISRETLSSSAPMNNSAPAAPQEPIESRDVPFDITPSQGPGGVGVPLLPAPSGKLSPEEVFANAYVRNGKDGAAAVRKAGLQDPRYDMDYVVRQLLSRPDVQGFVAQAEELAAVNRDVRQYTREFFLHELQETRVRAMEANQFGAAITATKTQAQLLGMMEQTVNINHSVSARELSLADLRALVQKKMDGDDARVVTGRVIDGDSGE